ncbi:hypothetical protein IU500_07000 [Nocardia terpenica]|uniref:hypothetical protein n=1 Tax=Nocardia terpenica TaxID=455432 RepID=UPI0018942A7A|nr:hypothetical protein [Nocardia terpenica]MBF6060524.1 hypothetical protein [Nocardia terpenica]MBF6103784.1 hypothetical protein [Nocardia terpenica]MBF6111842.1 hypothetical protein [Nocardia terpenica]MBF6118005.1 hypothetical protein [Nocardia terpenica]MBF6155269.1 hypothetical protein [Nocardia terpenica]
MGARWEELVELTVRCYPDAPLTTVERYAKTGAKFEELRGQTYRRGKKPSPTYYKLATILAALSEQVGIPRPSAEEWRGDDADWGVLRGVTHPSGFLPVDRAAILVDRDWKRTVDE